MQYGTSHSLLQPREAVEIGAYIIIHLPLQKLPTALLNSLSILTLQTEQVALELDALGLQCLIILFLHIQIALGMSQNRGIAFILDTLQ